jgi:hypothetical protein
MAKPNYQFEKRQRDLAKKKKREEKAAKKQQSRTPPERIVPGETPAQGAAGAPPEPVE